MRIRRAVLAAVLASLAPAASAVAAQEDGVEVRFAESARDVVLGDRFTLTSTVSGPPAGALAHLNVVSLTDEVYVDPEDWSPERSKAVGAAQQTWDLQAVNAGTFAVYVVVLPTGQGAGPVVVSPPVRLTVADRSTLDLGATLPVVVTVPLALGLLAGAVLYRSRRALTR